MMRMLAAIAALFLAAAPDAAEAKSLTEQWTAHFDRVDVRAMPVRGKIKAALVAVIGEDYDKRVAYSGSNPKGLMRDGHLMLRTGARHEIMVIGDLSADEIDAIQAEFETRLREELEPGIQYAIVSVQYYKKMIVEYNKETRAGRQWPEGLLAEFEFSR